VLLVLSCFSAVGFQDYCYIVLLCLDEIMVLCGSAVSLACTANSLDFVVNRFVMKLFTTSSADAKRTARPLQKY